MKKTKIKHPNKHKGISNCLRKFRKTRGLTQKQVARIIGIHNPSMISLWEHGEHIPKYENILKLAKLYRTMSEGLYLDYSREIQESVLKREEQVLHPKTEPDP